MKPSAVAKFKSIADVLTPEQARAFLEVVMILKQQPDHENLMIRDEAGEVLGSLFLPECHASPDDPPTDPAYLKELERRLQSPDPGPVMSAEEFLEYLEREELPDDDAEEN